jgi:hypothetical protein
VSARRAAFWALVGAKLVGAWGLAWDIQWHVTIGRDSFWIPPHVMMYVSVVIGFAVSFAVIARDTTAGVPAGLPSWRILGLDGTRGFHLAAWGMALVLLAAPIDDLWHRLFGIDVTLWSPPHLLGLGGAALNTLGCVLVATEVYPAGAAHLAGTLLSAALLYGGVRVVLDPAYLLAFTYGGVLFHAFAILGALALPFTLIVATRLTDRRWTPMAVVAVALAVGLSSEVVSAFGFAIVQPESAIREEIRKDPMSAIAQSHAIAEKNRSAPRPWHGRLIPLFAAAAMAAVDVRRRPVAATLAFAVSLFALAGWYLAQRPAFQPMLPGVGETLVALGLTLVAGSVGAIASRRFGGWLTREPAATAAGVPQPAT